MKKLILESVRALRKAEQRRRGCIDNQCHYQLDPPTATCTDCNRENYEPCAIRERLDKE